MLLSVTTLFFFGKERYYVVHPSTLVVFSDSPFSLFFYPFLVLVTSFHEVVSFAKAAISCMSY